MSSSNLNYLAKKVGSTIYADGYSINAYEVYSILNGAANILVGALETVTTSRNIQLNNVMVNTRFNMNITDVDNDYNFVWESASNINKELVVYTSSPACLATTNELSINNVSYSVSVANIFDNLLLNVSW